MTINGGTVTLIGDTNAFYPYDTLTLGDGVMAVALASKTGADATAYDPSQLSTYKYIQTSYELPVITVAAPVLPAAGKFTNSKTIEINCETDGAKIYYTTDGSEPTQNSTEYTAAFTINKTTTVKAIAILNGQSSEVASVTYTKRSGGSGGGTSYHAVVAENAENGAITARPSAAAAGTVVTLTPVPKESCTVERVIVMDKDGKEIPLTNNGDGTYRFTMPNGKVTVVATFTEIEHGAVCPSKGFSDIDPNAWYHEYVDYVVSKGLMQGVANDRFAPDITTTRAMIVTILHRLEGKPAVSGKVSFDDVEAGSWYADAVAWAEANEIVGGYGDGTFGPDDCITREQFAAILYRYAKFKGYDVSKSADLSGYADVSTISDWALPAIQWANAENLITGRTATMLVLRDNATRAEAAAILVRFLENVK
ncbi:MAG: S-layer homology domain-containing protein [Clostridia bacterium]|nr:S-layer homology domain-containing protein [Clostridia bacterium]